MIDEVGIDNASLPTQDGFPSFSVADELSRLKASKKIIRGSIFSIDFSKAQKAGEPRPVSALDDRVSSAAVQKIEGAENSKAQDRKQRQYAQKHEGIGGYLLGIGEMIAGGALMATGVMVEIGSLGFLTVAVGFQEAAGFALLTDGFARTMRSANDISTPKFPKYDPLLDIVNKPKEKPRKWDEPGSPPVRGDHIVGDGTVSPFPGFDDWRGKGDPASGRGSWQNSTTGQTLHPDLNHPPPETPHWDYDGDPHFPRGAKLYPDGTWVPK